MISQDAFILYPSATITTAGKTFTDEVNDVFIQAVYMVVDITVRDGTQTLAIAVEIYDEASAGWVEIDGLQLALDAVATKVYAIYPLATLLTGTGITETLGLALPNRWRLSLTTDTEDDITFSIGLIPIAL